MNGDPQFFDHNNGDYRISYDNYSPCIGMGNNSVTYASTDLKGDPRIFPVGGSIDIGAYEYENPMPPGPNDPHYKKTNSDTIAFEDYLMDFEVYPNPVEYGYTIRLNSEKDELAYVFLRNSLGQEVMKKTIEINKGENSFYFERGALNAGCYYLQIDSERLNSKKMVLIFK